MIPSMAKDLAKKTNKMLHDGTVRRKWKAMITVVNKGHGTQIEKIGNQKILVRLSGPISAQRFNLLILQRFYENRSFNSY